MFEAQLLIAKSAADVKVYSPWFPRGGDYLRPSVEIVDFVGGGSNKLEVHFFTKKQEETGNGNAISGTGTDILATGTGVFNTGTSGVATEVGPDKLNELVRYEFKVPSGTAGDWVLLRMLPPVWFDAVKA